jgi:hypothetical protein
MKRLKDEATFAPRRSASSSSVILVLQAPGSWRLQAPAFYWLGGLCGKAPPFCFDPKGANEQGGAWSPKPGAYFRRTAAISSAVSISGFRMNHSQT